MCADRVAQQRRPINPTPILAGTCTAGQSDLHFAVFSFERKRALSSAPRRPLQRARRDSPPVVRKLRLGIQPESRLADTAASCSTLGRGPWAATLSPSRLVTAIPTSRPTDRITRTEDGLGSWSALASRQPARGQASRLDSGLVADATRSPPEDACATRSVAALAGAPRANLETEAPGPLSSRSRAPVQGRHRGGCESGAGRTVRGCLGIEGLGTRSSN
jgi:hypothetical protein